MTETALTLGQRFEVKMTEEYSASIGSSELSEKQKALIRSYFVSIDNALKAGEIARLKKKYNQDQVPVKWENVNVADLARNVVHMAKVGLNPMVKNHLWTIPYKNRDTGKYDIQLMEGYEGLKLKVMRYALDQPIDVITELVYSNDVFQVLKKDSDCETESYIFDVKTPFDRGEIIGGFYYIMYDDPRKNRLKLFTVHDIEKRKPAYASPEFWGGEKDEYKNGKKTGQKIQVEGWKEEMYIKTIKRSAWGSVTIDSGKIDEDYLAIESQQQYEVIDDETPKIEDAAEKSNVVTIDVEPGKADPEKTEASEEEQIRMDATDAEVTSDTNLEDEVF